MKKRIIVKGYWWTSDDDGKNFKNTGIAVTSVEKNKHKDYGTVENYQKEKNIKLETKKEEKPKEGKPSTTKEQGAAKPSSGYNYENDPEYIKTLDEIHKSNPSPVVTKVQYEQLERLHKAALAADPTASGKETEEAGLFQQKFHEYLPEVATKIIATDQEPTRLAKKMGWTKYDLRGNVDKRYGRRTKQYFDTLEQFKPKEKELEKELPELTTKEKEKIPEEEQTIKRYNPQAVLGNKRAPWWLQDIVKTTGDANDLMRIKKYMPWQAKPAVHLPDATFYDPTRELAANAEQANIQTQGMAAFTGPQALSARSSAIQGQGAKNAADILARYNNLNVGIANQLSAQRSDIMNTAEQNQANMDTQLWDKYTIANQQFDNSKNQARQHLRQSYIDAITNRAKTQALNTMYSNYQTDPSRGGTLAFNPNYTPTPTYKGDTNEFDEAVKKYGNVENASKYMDWKNGKTSKKASSDYPYEGYQGNEV